MKFEQMFQDATLDEPYHVDSHNRDVTKIKGLGNCKRCGAVTRWVDKEHYVCSVDCMVPVPKPASNEDRWEMFHREVATESEIASKAEDASKDIIIVVRDQFELFKECVESVKENTKNFHLYVWDNDSGNEVKDYLQDLFVHCDPDIHGWSIQTVTSDCNMGFIEPNNELVGYGDSDYIILLNSDTRVSPEWDTTMLGILQQWPEVALVGSVGGLLDESGKGIGGDHGWDIDFISGWNMCLSRETYNKFGLFNHQLKFAYAEDCDLCLRLKAAGKKIYAMYSPLVYHHGNKTIAKVREEGEIDVVATFKHNHEYIKLKWQDYLENDRILLSKEAPLILEDRPVFGSKAPRRAKDEYS